MKTKQAANIRESYYRNTISGAMHAFKNGWVPSTYIAFNLLLVAQLLSAVWSGISDCDETFNYWEPTHYLLYKSGFETWEYSPTYALRSYTYVLMHGIMGWLYSTVTFSDDRVSVFYFIRCVLALTCACCELYFYNSVRRKLGSNVARLTLVFLLVSAGMHISGAAYLPSSFAMYCTMVAVGSWLRSSYSLAVFSVALSSLLGWPFAALTGLPLAIDILFVKGKVLSFIKWCLVSGLFILMPLVLIDSYFYGKLVVAPLNLLVYNVFSSKGPELYGVSPWHFYVVNGFLNFNFVFLTSVLSLPLLVIKRFVTGVKTRSLQAEFSVLPLFCWLGLFTFLPHKEERFLFPVYPLVCLAGAISLDTIQSLFASILVRWKLTQFVKIINLFSILYVFIVSLWSISRILSLYVNYSAPINVYVELNRLGQSQSDIQNQRPISVCVGKEWHRFPTSFLLLPNYNLKFLRSEFRGQLPQDYGVSTREFLPNFNDDNLEEPSRYFDVTQCNFLIDLETATSTTLEPSYVNQTDRWKQLYYVSFLNTVSSHWFFRAFYIPLMSEKYCSFSKYVILKSIRF